jgi:hypothetical protein
MTAVHRPYYRERLDDIFCVACGDFYPCLPVREASACRCSHDQTQHDEIGCVIFACGCRSYRPKGVTA